MLSLLKAVPVWAYALAVVLAGWAFTAYQLQGAQGKRDAALAEVARLTTAIDTQKREADKLLKAEQAKTKTVENELAAAVALQNEKDQNAKAVVDDLTGKLRNAGRLRDPNASGCRSSGGSTPAASAPATRGSAADPAETDGLLSAQLSGLFKRLTREADEINNAYASCKPDGERLREILNSSP